MHIIARPAIENAKQQHPQCRSWLDNWWQGEKTPCPPLTKNYCKRSCHARFLRIEPTSAAMGQIEQLMRNPKRNRAEDEMVELLATLIEQYEIRQGYSDPVLSPRDRLAGLMEAREMTQTDLSQRSKVPRTTINEILRGKRGISKTNAVRLANLFHVPIDEFIGKLVR